MYGYCYYGDYCQFRHVDEICDDKNCNVFDCERRHPRICNYFRNFQRCKFTTYCSYKHEKLNNVNENSEKIVKLENKLREIEKTEPTEKNNEKKQEALGKKIEEQGNEIKILKDVIESKFKNMEEHFEQKTHDLSLTLNGV